MDSKQALSLRSQVHQEVEFWPLLIDIGFWIPWHNIEAALWDKAKNVCWAGARNRIHHNWKDHSGWACLGWYWEKLPQSSAHWQYLACTIWKRWLWGGLSIKVSRYGGRSRQDWCMGSFTMALYGSRRYDLLWAEGEMSIYVVACSNMVMVVWWQNRKLT